MPTIRAKASKKAKVTPQAKDEHDIATQRLKETLKITPKTARHLYGMGYTTPESLKPPKITPGLLEVQMQDYLERTNQTFQSAPKRSGAMFRVAFRRILWIARATDKEKEMYPERMTCNFWSNKAIAAREAAAVQKEEEDVSVMLQSGIEINAKQA